MTISANKYKILQHCNNVPSGIKITSETLGISYNVTSTTMSHMKAEELLTYEEGVYSTTPFGRTEMRLYAEAQRRTVPAPKINKFDGVYIPSVSYQRNQGNKHILSRDYI